MLGRSLCTVGILLGLGGWAWGQSSNHKSGPWVLEQSGTTASLRGVHSLGGGVAWVSGADGTVLRTEDGGYEWQSCAVPEGAEKLDFRGIWAWDANSAIVMASGAGDQSRLYRTKDGCSHWTQVLADPDTKGFFDAIFFTSRQVGYVLGDPVDGAFPLFRTADGGATWARIESKGLATAAQGSAAFAASNSILTGAGSGADERVWFVTGGEGGAFIYDGTPNCPKDGDGPVEPSCLTQWNFHRTALPMAGDSASSGAFSLWLVCWNVRVKSAVAVGGDYTRPDEAEGTSVWAPDGKNWTPSEKPPHGYRSGVTWDADLDAWIAVGTNGSDVSWDGGRHWKPLDDGNWNALNLPFVVGSGGKIGKINLDDLHK